MVFLRLTVKIFPREQQPSSSSFSLRSILGDRGSDREDATRNANTTSSGKPASFLLVLTEPQDVTLGGLAGMIREKWVKLRPNAEPLHIKKLLDDDHEADDLDADMTVADVFVDNGLSQVDGRDQRRTVRVIQKPAPYVPTRFPSVSLDWDAAAEDFQRQQSQRKKDTVQKFPAIAEEASVSHEESFSDVHRENTRGSRDGQDTPVKSVEDDEEIPGSPQPEEPEQQGQPQVHEPDSQGNGEKTVEATPQHATTTTTTTTISTDAHAPGHGHPRMESQELGSPTPTARARRRSTSARGRPAQRTISRMADMRTPVGSVDEDEAVESDEEEVSPPGRRMTRSKVQRQKADKNDQEKEEEKDQDGDIGMGGNEKTTRLGKRKNSKEDLRPSKEPRLDSQEPDRSLSPSATRKPSFSRTGRRTSFTEQHSPPKPGLGLGITQSPSRKRPAVDPPSSSASVLAASVLSSGAKPTAPEKDTTPSSKLLTPFSEKEPSKPLHSALRKPSPVDKPSEPRSVSFSGKKDIIPARPTQEPKSTPTPAPASDTAATPTDQWLDKMHFPPTISSEHAKQLVQEEKKKIERENEVMREDEEKLKRAKDEDADPEFIRLLEELCRTRAWIANAKASSGKTKMEKQIKQAEQKVANLRKKLERLEAKEKGKAEKAERAGNKNEKRKSDNKTEKTKSKGEKNKPGNKADKRPESKSEHKTDNNPGENKEKSKSKSPDPKSTDKSDGPEKGNKKDKGQQKGRSNASASAESESATSAKNAEPAESAEPAADAEPAEQTQLQNKLTNGDIPAGADPSDSGNQADAQQPEARPESRTEPETELQSEPEQEPPKASEPPQLEVQQKNQTSDEQSDDLKLPAMPNVRSVEQSKRSPVAPSPAPASAPASQKQTEESSSSSSSSSSDSDSDSSSDGEEEPNPSGISQSQPQPQTGSRFSSPWARAQTQTPSQSQPQSQPHTQPFQAINRTSSRTSLSSLKNIMDQQKSEHDARVQQTRQASHQRRKDIFDPSSDSDDDDDDDDSESDSDSDNESKSSVDEGDIQSSGTVGKLRKAISWRSR